MDYSVQAYITRLSTEKLEEFLCQCERNGETEAYGYIIPDIRKLLEKRKEKKEKLSACRIGRHFSLISLLRGWW